MGEGRLRAARYGHQTVSQRPLELRITLDGQPVHAATAVADQGPPWVVTITTSLPDQALELSSTYVGRRGTPTHIVRVAIAPGRHITTSTDERPQGALPVTHAREHLLHDHLAALHTHAATHHAGTLAATVDDATVAAVALA